MVITATIQNSLVGLVRIFLIGPQSSLIISYGLVIFYRCLITHENMITDQL